MPKIIVLFGTDNDALVAAHDRTIDDAGARLPRGLWPMSLHWPECGGDGRPRHPSMHGVEADNAIVATRTGRRDLVVVTHSDVFMLRLRNRIAEQTLAPADVLFVWVEPDGTQKPVPLNDRGTPDWWPKGVGAEALAEFRAIRRALGDRDTLDATTPLHADVPTLSQRGP